MSQQDLAGLKSASVPKGVMAGRYAQARESRGELIYRYRTRAHVVMRAARKHLGRATGLSLLDFGSAEGRTLLCMDEIAPGNQLLGIEYSGELLANTPSLPANIRIEQGDVMALDERVGAGKFDLVSALALLEHVPDPARVVAQAALALRPGGIFVATCPNPFWDRVASTLGLLKGDHHVQEMNRTRLKTAVRDGGLELVEFRRFMWTPTGILPYLGISLPPTIALRIDGGITRTKVLNWSFVNQVVIGRKATVSEQ